MSEIIQAIADVQQVAGAVSDEPNWLVIGIILGIMVILAIVFMIPSKSQPMLEDGDEDDEKKSLTGEKREALGAEETGEKKDKLSLAEIKKEKRANVSEEKSKEELRELRRERRAATQTEKAVSERENAEDAESAKEVKAEAKSEPEAAKVEAEKEVEPVKADETAVSEAVKAAEEAARKAAEEAAEADRALKSAEEEARKAREKLDEMARKTKELERSLEADVVSNAEPEDVFSSLFGDEDSSLGFDDFSKSDSKPVEGTVFPTLGSALIPLEQLSKAADEAEAEIDPFEELTKRMAAKAEKKTLK